MNCELLSNKKILVTAAGQGIGRETASFLADCGGEVIATDRDAGLLRGLADGRKISTAPLDVTDTAAVDRLAGEIGPIDVLLNVAGIVHQGTILDCDEPAWDLSFDVNIKSMYRTIRAFLPGMLDRGGSIINISSVASSIKGVPNRCVYAATKAAVIGLTKAVAADFASRQVRCNAVCPGTIVTPSLRARIDEAPDPEAAMRSFMARHPVGRLGEPKEIAAYCAYLASDLSAFTTGTALVIDGAMTL